MIAPAVVAIASQLAGEAVSVSCERNARFSDASRAYTMTLDETDGAIVFDPVIHLAAATCNELNRLVVRDTRKAPAGIVTNGGTLVDLVGGSAVHLLEHEALHIRLDSIDEAFVEHEAELNRWSAVRLFGLAADRARQVMRGFMIAHCSASRAPVDYLADGAC